MKKYISIFLVTMIFIMLYSQHGLSTDLSSQCMSGVPNYNRSLIQDKTSELPITITSDYVKGNYPNNAAFIGNVNINQGNSLLRADEVQLHQKNLDGCADSMRTVDAFGNVQYDNNQIVLKGLKGWLNLNTKDINIWGGNYQMVDRQGRGEADLIKQRCKNRYTILENGSFTSCLPSSNSWSIVGSKIIYDYKKQIVKIWNARFKLGPIPVFYIPYLQLPIGDKCRSGFLIPSVKYNTINYFEVYFPYCWNIAPNVDFTVTPHYIHRYNNIMWENEFRYSTKIGIGKIELYYLPLYKIPAEEYLKKSNYNRWMYHWKHFGVIDKVWSFKANYTKINDPYYLNYFSSKYGYNKNDHTMQMFNVGYATQCFNAMASLRKFQISSTQTSDIYKIKPKLDINWYLNNTGPFDIQINGQAVRFISNNPKTPRVTYVHLEPSINLPWSKGLMNLNFEAKLLATHYQQQNLDNYNIANNTKLEKSVSRILPQFKINGKLSFKREVSFENGYIQILEPRIQYFYIPYHNQKAINNYNSSFLQYDYIRLFCERNYGGLNRIASENQLAVGISSHVIDNNFVERFTISGGQIYCFTESYSGEDNSCRKNTNNAGSLIWIGDIYWNMTNHVCLRGYIQHSAQLDDVTIGNVSAEYRRNKDCMVQLTYRYANPKYIQVVTPKYSTPKRYNHGISQIGGISSWSIVNRWSVIGGYYFDTNTRRSVNQKFGLQYNSCCYAIHIGYEHKLSGWNSNSNKSIHNNIIGFNLELRGLGFNHDLGTEKMLRSSILPYRSSF